jgi:hypothetical protein
MNWENTYPILRRVEVHCHRCGQWVPYRRLERDFHSSPYTGWRKDFHSIWEEEPGTVVIAGEDGGWCDHIDPEVFPARGEGEYEIYFQHRE